MSEKSEQSVAGPPGFGLPEQSPLTVEGRIERAASVATHLTRHRDGRERSLRSSNFAMGLILIAIVLGAVIGLAGLLSLLG